MAERGSGSTKDPPEALVTPLAIRPSVINNSANASTNAAEVASPRFGKPLQRPNPTAGKLRAHERAEASHERLADPPGGIPYTRSWSGSSERRRKFRGERLVVRGTLRRPRFPLFEFCLKFNI